MTDRDRGLRAQLILFGLVLLVLACSGSDPAAPESSGEREPSTPFINVRGAYWMVSPAYLENGTGDPFRYRYFEELCDQDPEQTNYRETGPSLVEFIDREAEPEAWDRVGRESLRTNYDCPIVTSNHSFYTTDDDVQYRATRDSAYFTSPRWEQGRRVGTDTIPREWIWKDGWSESVPAGFYRGEINGVRLPYFHEDYLGQITDREPPNWGQL